ncbi:hypothetical protein BDZ89DRAFT_1038198 [Hymenopellis radicata]|nr:hypothetical protein BDZ89DRAFT_1038198 [Hymenopellis radicata]
MCFQGKLLFILLCTSYMCALAPSDAVTGYGGEGRPQLSARTGGIPVESELYRVSLHSNRNVKGSREPPYSDSKDVGGLRFWESSMSMRPHWLLNRISAIRPTPNELLPRNECYGASHITAERRRGSRLSVIAVIYPVVRGTELEIVLRETSLRLDARCILAVMAIREKVSVSLRHGNLEDSLVPPWCLDRERLYAASSLRHPGRILDRAIMKSRIYFED